MLGTPSHPQLPLRVERRGSFTVLHVAGEIDISTAPHLGHVLERIQGVADTGVAVELAEVEYIDSTALHVLVEAQRRASVEGGRLVLVGLVDGPRRLLELSGLGDAFTLVPSLAALDGEG